MMKKMFALASVTALTGLVATMSAVGCSSTNTVTDGSEAGPGTSNEAGPKKEAGTPILDDSGPGDTDGGGIPEEKTVGKECTSTADCKVAGSKNDNSCSKGFFTAGDLFGSPVCVQSKCTQGNSNPPTVGDLLCDDQTGLCLPSGSSGICLPFCSYDSTKVIDACAGGNKCNIAYLGTDAMKKSTAIGFCFGACTADTDCKGTAGQKCQVEDGLCVNADKHVTYTAVGTACTRDPSGAAPATCNCNTVGNLADGGAPANADKGYCTHSCITGAAGDAVCNTAKATWKCTAKLPLVDSMNPVLFTAQPSDVSGTCAQTCTMDSDCGALVTSSGLPAANVKCKTYADGKYCDATAN
jgi:hypothetical protein